jgi:hypothetical protein
MSHLTFHQALAQAEAQARSTLAPALHERLSCAVSLVKDGRVFQASDGTWQVDSTSRAGLVYSVNGTCACDDVHYNRPPKDLCKHRLAMFLSQRVLTLMRQPPQPVVPEGVELAPPPVEPPVEPWPDNDAEELPAAPGDAPAAAPLPEAPSSANVRLQIQGYEVQVTLRDHREEALLARLARLLQQYPAPQTPARAQEQGEDWCSKHQVTMQHNTKNGRQWYSHKTAEGQWCKGK